MKYLLFGTGDYYERYKKWFDKAEVAALLDNSPLKQNTTIDGIKVVSPQEGIQLEYDAIVILSFHVKSMKEQLIKLGVNPNSIYHFFDLHKLFKGKSLNMPVQYFGNALKIVQKRNGSAKKILLISHDLTLGGPALALYHAAVISRGRGYEVLFASMLDGPLRRRLEDDGFSVLVDPNLQIGTMQEITWVLNFNLIICNTVSFYVFLSERNMEVPVIWWLHEPEFYYDGVDKELLTKTDWTNVRVVSVGPIPKSAIRKWIPQLEVESLLYGVADVGNRQNTEILYPSRDKATRKKICFVTIGFIVEHKAQDVLMKAVKTLGKELQEKTEFYFVGQDTTLWAKQLKVEANELDNIYFTGLLDRNQIHQMLDHADVLICPSRQDSMPTVAAEAMMHSVPCILSDATGTAAYIRDGEDGLVFQSENAKELSEKISWCVSHEDNLTQMGALARKVYERVFSMDAFEENLWKVVNRML